ncbi:MAG: DNA-directed RNA polymerase subunit omega [Bacteroidetes bacterium]|nr:DNA-directed RNA polymerase subunit omega [Bacteroidota bacterium]MBL6942936.1 DNA-directed RNA polymerase subunit omega [Bacteroidales bacterium]
MDYKKIKTETTAVTRKKEKFYEQTGNIYETVVVLSKRANQIGHEIKRELDQKIEEFSPATDNLEEVFENREQIEIARFYEGLPKPTLLAVNEFLKKEIYIRNPHKEKVEL